MYSLYVDSSGFSSFTFPLLNTKFDKSASFEATSFVNLNTDCASNECVASKLIFIPVCGVFEPFTNSNPVMSNLSSVSILKLIFPSNTPPCVVITFFPSVVSPPISSFSIICSLFSTGG